MKLFYKFLKRANKALKLFPNPLYLHALLHGVAAAIEYEKMLRLLRFNTAIDIGANVGQFSLVVRNTYPDVNIYAFEPLAEPIIKFNKVFKNKNNVKIFQAAIGEERKLAEFFVSKREDSSSLLPITDEQVRVFPGTELQRTQKVELGRLEDYLSENDLCEPVLIKIDVQGYELKALEGCKHYLEFVAYIIIECSFKELYKDQALADEIVRYLHSNNYELIGIYNVSYDSGGQAIQANLLFESKLNRKN